MIQEYYRQMRKFGCNILAVIQQYDIIKESAVRGAMIGNSKMLPTVGFYMVSRKSRSKKDDVQIETPDKGVRECFQGDFQAAPSITPLRLI